MFTESVPSAQALQALGTPGVPGLPDFVSRKLACIEGGQNDSDGHSQGGSLVGQEPNSGGASSKKSLMGDQTRFARGRNP